MERRKIFPKAVTIIMSGARFKISDLRFRSFSGCKTGILYFWATNFTGGEVIICFLPTGLSGAVITRFGLYLL